MSTPVWKTTPFEPGQRISFAGDEFIVVTNHGDHGMVREPGPDGQQVRMYWRFEGEDCVLVPESPAQASATA